MTFYLSGCILEPNEKMGIFDKFRKKQKDQKSKELEFDVSASNSEKLATVKIGEINLPTGEIITGDPFFTSDIKPFTRKVKPGHYQVELLIATIEEDHYRLAYSKIKFKNERATRWVLATTPDMNIEELEPGEFYGFPVDAGLGCFVDKSTNELFIKRMHDLYKSNPESNYYDDVLAAEFGEYSGNHKYSRGGGDWNNHIVDKESGFNVIMFSSGWGDGTYPTFWGMNDKNEIVELTIDFLVGQEDEEE